eukprot:6212718-Pleurochrysis_carterae.AAC.1
MATASGADCVDVVKSVGTVLQHRRECRAYSQRSQSEKRQRERLAESHWPACASRACVLLRAAARVAAKADERRVHRDHVPDGAAVRQRFGAGTRRALWR